MIPWSSHRILRREVELSGYLVADSPIRIGSGREPPLGSSVDLAVVRIKLGDKDVPYIPGSSVKGVFRSAATAISLEKGLEVCSGLGRETCMTKVRIDNVSLLEYIQNLLRRGKSFEAIKTFHEKACLLCKIFGAPSFTGHIEFDDGYPIINGEILDVPVRVKTGIAIDRRTGAVYRGALYQVEFVDPGAKFRFNVRATNLPNYALGLLAKILRMVDEGWIRLGGFKTRGFGRVKINNLSFKVRGETDERTLKPLDEFDSEVELKNAENSNGWLITYEDSAWKALRLLEEVWDRADIKK